MLRNTCCSHVEGGRYISPEFLSHVDDGQNLEQSVDDRVILYRPLYVCIARQHDNDTQHLSHQIKKSASMISRSALQLTVPEAGHCLEMEPMSADDYDDDDDDNDDDNDDYNSSLDKTDYQ
ncbi:unnamed protein product [Acanthocheilonema viteae]|uniref:Uncharacterized protein n=1 Tax=Acanthocheilonema viteae TaxID=6277 RepID=A0A498SVN2_ACAVI|nr:unnamed protein product [Acanthocheilonema viteae]